jgi:hypothetical protein
VGDRSPRRTGRHKAQRAERRAVTPDEYGAAGLSRSPVPVA